MGAGSTGYLTLVFSSLVSLSSLSQLYLLTDYFPDNPRFSETVHSTEVASEFRHRFQDQTKTLETIADIIIHNYQNRTKMNKKDHTFLLIAGGSGIGKSRIAYETQNIFRLLPLEKHGELRELFNQNLLFLSVAFDNGIRFCKEEIGCTPSVRLGARLAIVSGLVEKVNQPLSSLISCKNSMEFIPVLQAILQRFRKQKGIDNQSVVPIIIHLDEYQKYISEYEVYAQLSCGSELSRTFFKSLLQEIGRVMTPRDTASSLVELGHYFIVPIITGTSEVDLRVLLTDHRRVARTLKPLTKDSAQRMFYDKYEYRRSKVYTDSQKEMLKKSLAEFTGSKELSDEQMETASTELCNQVWEEYVFQIALQDTAFIPYLLDSLFYPEVLELRYPWGREMVSRADQLSSVLSSMRKEEVKALLYFALTGHEVTRQTVLPGSSKSIGSFEREGLIFLSFTDQIQGVESNAKIILPFVDLVILNAHLPHGDEVLPVELLFQPSWLRPWTWDSFEQLTIHFISAMLYSLHNIKQMDSSTQQSSFSLNDVFRGARGDRDLLTSEVLIPSTKLQVRVESEKCLQETTSTLKATTEIVCNDRKLPWPLSSCIFQCALGCANIDFRFSLDRPKPALPFAFFGQVKHSRIETENNTVPSTFLLKWYNTTMKSVAEFKRTHQVVLIFFTNRRVSGNIQFSDMPNLILLDISALPTYFTPTLAARGICVIEETEQTVASLEIQDTDPFPPITDRKRTSVPPSPPTTQKKQKADSDS